MKKVQLSQQLSSTHIALNDDINPEQCQTRCKICFEEKMPLVTLCQCTGSIAYVHEDCILDWIALKMEKSQLIEIPKCQICKAKFSAALKIGSKKIDNALLIQKIKTTTRNQWITFITSIVGFLIAFISILMAGYWLLIGEAINLESLGAFFISGGKIIFLQIGFPTFFIRQRSKYFKQKWKAMDACKVQLVEVTLLPKKILKA